MAAPFVMGDEFKAQLARIKKNAEHNPYSKEAMIARIKGEPEPGNTKEGGEPLFTCLIPIGYKVVYTIETVVAADFTTTHGMCRHLSMSNVNGKIPHPLICQEVMNELGFVNSIDGGQCIVYPEKGYIINVLEFI